jgi:hypothetical protein
LDAPVGFVLAGVELFFGAVFFGVGVGVGTGLIVPPLPCGIAATDALPSA